MENEHPLTAWRSAQEPKLSQKDLAEKLGVSRWYVNRLEVGATTPSPQIGAGGSTSGRTTSFAQCVITEPIASVAIGNAIVRASSSVGRRQRIFPAKLNRSARLEASETSAGGAIC